MISSRSMGRHSWNGAIVMWSMLITVAISASILLQLQSAFAAVPGSGDARTAYNKAVKFELTQHWPDAVQQYSRCIRSQPDCIAAYLGLGHCLVELRQFENASIVYETALKLAPHNRQLNACLGHVYQLLGRYGDAEWCNRRAKDRIDGLS